MAGVSCLKDSRPSGLMDYTPLTGPDHNCSAAQQASPAACLDRRTHGMNGEHCTGLMEVLRPGGPMGRQHATLLVSDISRRRQRRLVA